jgi:general secretion pathway protein J
MGRPLAQVQQADAGFTLIEVVVAVALMGLIVGTLATVTAQWLPNWKRGLLRAQRNEQVAIALDRLVADLSAAEFVSPNRLTRVPLFQGDEQAVTFVRSAVGPNSSPGLEIVQIAEIADGRGPALVRMRAPFIPLSSGDPSLEPIPFADPVVLLRAPLRIAFAYAGPDGKWMKFWRNAGDLPTEVRFVVRDADADRGALISTATRIHVDMMAPRPDQVDEPSRDAVKSPPNGASGLQ